MNGTPLFVNLLNGSVTVARSGINIALQFTKARKRFTLDTLSGSRASAMALTFPPIGPMPRFDRTKPMKVSFDMSNTHFSLLRVRPLPSSLVSTFSNRLSYSASSGPCYLRCWPSPCSLATLAELPAGISLVSNVYRTSISFI